MRARDVSRVDALRVVTAALQNAEAADVDGSPADAAGSRHFAGAAAGLGSTEAPRRTLREADILRIIEVQIAELVEGARIREGLDRTDEAARLRRQADVLSEYLTSFP